MTAPKDFTARILRVGLSNAPMGPTLAMATTNAPHALPVCSALAPATMKRQYVTMAFTACRATVFVPSALPATAATKSTCSPFSVSPGGTRMSVQWNVLSAPPVTSASIQPPRPPSVLVANGLLKVLTSAMSAPMDTFVITQPVTMMLLLK